MIMICRTKYSNYDKLVMMMLFLLWDESGDVYCYILDYYIFCALISLDICVMCCLGMKVCSFINYLNLHDHVFST